MNDVIKVLNERRSSRKYLDKMPSDEELNAIIEAGLRAPSGMNKQGSIILCIKDKELRDKLEMINAKIATGRYDGKPFYNAPVVFVVLYDKSVGTGIYDATLTAGNMLNAAYSLGLGSCWIHRAKETFESPEWKELLKSFGLEGEYEGVANVIVGYNDPSHKPFEKAIKENRIFVK